MEDLTLIMLLAIAGGLAAGGGEAPGHAENSVLGVRTVDRDRPIDGNPGFRSSCRGIEDGDEVDLGTGVGTGDTDGDGLDDGFEINVAGTDPIHWDSNGNGVSDDRSCS